MNSPSVEKAKLLRLLDFLETGKKSRTQKIALQSQLLANAREAARYIDDTYLRVDANLTTLHGYQVKYRYDLETRVTQLSSGIDMLAIEVRNLEKAAGELRRKLEKLQHFEASKSAEIELSEFIARNHHRQVSLGQGRWVTLV